LSLNNPTKVTPNPVAPPQAPKDPEKSIQELEMLKFKWVKDLLEWKQKKLAEMATGPVVENITKAQDALNKLQQEEAVYKSANRGFLASAGEDCAAVKAILAELWLSSADMLLPDGVKKATAADREAWLRGQRTSNKQLAAAILDQIHVLASTEEYRINIDQAKRKVESTLAVLRLKTAQIEFLGRSI
jgi:hypothetical protein